MTKICKHICYFYLEKRINYINRIIDECNIYPYETDIFIHTNVELNENTFNSYNNGKISIIVHTSFKDNNPFYLSWKCRELLEKQVDLYDIFIYIEDDILIYKDTLDYWLKYKDICIKNNFNLGFLRVEYKNNETYWVDSPNVKIRHKIILDNMEYAVNIVQPYCASWIYDKNEFIRWKNSNYWNIENIRSLGQQYIREVSAIGFSNEGYSRTIIPIVSNRLHENCIVYHQDDKFCNDPTTPFGKLNFKDAVN
jgi:hypothetical protein